ncbi:MAG: DUF72 domain-containing protein [Rhodothermales bacterium]|nr:DUF72 domain-containing protein [Rhodothermales bacterium]
MQLHVGTSGFSYKEWKGSFYPENLPNAGMLEYYAGRLPAVEINNTFYRLPRTSVIENWATTVPESFRFIIKASRRITHFKRLKEPFDETDYLLETVGVLGDRLGAVLFQLPPNMKKDAERLTAFLEHLPADVPSAFEFRNDSWFDDETIDILRRHQRAVVHADTDEKPITELTETADWGYLRLRRPGYSEGDLKDWRDRLRSTKWSKAFVFFKHEDEGAGPRMASQFLKLMA